MQTLVIYLSKPQDLLSAPARPGFIQIPAVLASLRIQPFASPSRWLDVAVDFHHLYWKRNLQQINHCVVIRLWTTSVLFCCWLVKWSSAHTHFPEPSNTLSTVIAKLVTSYTISSHHYHPLKFFLTYRMFKHVVLYHGWYNHGWQCGWGGE